MVIDGVKALRAAVERVLGGEAEVQRCQIHNEFGNACGPAGVGCLTPHVPR